MTVNQGDAGVDRPMMGSQTDILQSCLTKLEHFDDLSESQRTSLLGLIVHSSDKYPLQSGSFCCNGGLERLLYVATHHQAHFADVCRAFFGLAESGVDAAQLCSRFLFEKQTMLPTEAFKQEANLRCFIQMHCKMAHKVSNHEEGGEEIRQPVKTCLYAFMFALQHASPDSKGECVKQLLGFPLKQFWILLIGNVLCLQTCILALLSGGPKYRQVLLHFIGKLKEVLEFDQLKVILLQSMLERSGSFFKKLKREESAMLLEALFVSFPQQGSWLITETCAYEQLQQLLNCNDDNTVKLMMGILPHLASSKEGKEKFNAPEVQRLLSKAGRVNDDQQIKSNCLLTLAKIAKSESNHDEDETLAMGALAMLEAMNEGNLASDSFLEVATHLVETLVFLVENNAVKDMIAERMVESKIGTLCKKTDKNPSLCFGLSHIFHYVVATKSEMDMVHLLTEEIDDDARQRQIASQMMKQSDDSFQDTDTPEKGRKRKECSVKASGVASLAMLVKNSSSITKTNISETLFHMAAESSIRANMVQQGAITLIFKLVKEEDKKCKALAAHALARILISVNPALLNDGHIIDCVGPLITLINREYALQQFEGLLALTNLATIGMEIQDLIISKGFNIIEELQWSNHKMVVRAATELFCNCVSCEKVLLSMQDEAKLKIWISLAFSEDIPTALAASGAIAMASNDDRIKKSLRVGDFVDLAKSKEAGLQHRARVILENLKCE